MPLASRILDSRSWISSSWAGSKKQGIDIGRMLLVRSMPFSPVPNCISPVSGERPGFLLLSTTGSKVPYRSALFALNFSISSTSHARGSISASASASSFSSQESGSLKMFSAMALPGIPLRDEVKGVEDIKGESRMSSSG